MNPRQSNAATTIPATTGPAPGKNDRIHVQREWVGAPEGTLANPTVWLFVATVASFGSATGGYLAGALPAFGALGAELVLLAVAVAALATGNFTALAVVWFVPALFAMVFLTMAFDYLPHYPCDSSERYLDSRAYPGRTAFVVLLGQNYHLIHHLWTTVPWYRYPIVFDAIRPQLEARGARIAPAPNIFKCL